MNSFVLIGENLKQAIYKLPKMTQEELENMNQGTENPSLFKLFQLKVKEDNSYFIKIKE